jgi:hypothetical protein
MRYNVGCIQFDLINLFFGAIAKTLNTLIAVWWQDLGRDTGISAI